MIIQNISNRPWLIFINNKNEKQIIVAQGIVTVDENIGKGLLDRNDNCWIEIKETKKETKKEIKNKKEIQNANE